MPETKSTRQRTKAPRVQPLQPVSQAELANVLGIARETVRMWTIEGMPRLDSGQYDMRVCVQWAKTHRWERQDDAEPIELSRARKEAAEAAMAELRLAKEQGRLMTLEDYERFCLETFGQLKAHLLTLPARAAPDFVGLGSQKESRELLREHIRDLMRRLERWDDDGDS